VCIPYQDHPNRGRRIRTYPVVERNESVYIWHDVERREPYFDAPDVFAAFGDGSSADDYYPQQRLYRESLELHPQYVLENGVDFAHFKYVHNTPIVPVFTRHDFDEPVSFVDFTITFEGDDGQKIEDVNSGVEAINGGLGIAVTKSWGMVDNRTISAITPVDESTSDVRFMVYIGRMPGKDPARAATRAQEFGSEVIRQFEQDVEIWQHQRYSDPPALAADEYQGFTAIRKWAKQFYPDGIGGSAAEVYAASQKG
jgi:phenylpropionate dioxygenase-like ring-hydroxylating dioxygenase large terminal subunit